MRAKYIDCGAGQIKLWQAALLDFDVQVDVHTSPFAIEDLPAMLDGYDICIDDHTRIPPEILAQLRTLHHFVYFGTGAASILDLPKAQRIGIEVHTIRNYGDTTVAELAAGLVFAAARQIAPQHAVIVQGGWTKMPGTLSASHWTEWGARGAAKRVSMHSTIRSRIISPEMPAVVAIQPMTSRRGSRVRRRPARPRRSSRSIPGRPSTSGHWIAA